MTGKFITKLEYCGFKRGKVTLISLKEELIYKSSKDDKITVPKEFVSDGASIPKFAWSLVGHPFGEYLASAVVHDYLWRSSGTLSKRRVDWILLDAMKTQGVAFWKRHVMHKAVRLNRGFLWLLRK